MSASSSRLTESSVPPLQRPRRPGPLAVLTAVLLAGLTATAGCDDAAENGNGGRLDQRYIPPSESKIRTIRGVELEKLGGPVGEWARGEAKEHEQERQRQAWVQPVDMELGEQPVGKLIIGKFKLRNPTDKAHRIDNVTSSCGCQGVVIRVGNRKYDIDKGGHDPIPVPAGAAGVVEAHITVPDRVGLQHTEVQLQTTDPDVPSVRLSITHVPVQEFIVESGGERRNAIDLGVVTYSSCREFAFDVRSHDGKPFEIKGHLPLPEGMKLSYQPAGEDGSRWRIEGTVGPVLKQLSFNGIVSFDTDRDKVFEIRVYALVKPPIRIQPSSTLMFGLVSRRKGATKELRLSAVDSADTFQVAKVEVFDVKPAFLPEGVPFGAGFENAADGKSAKIRVAVPPGAKRGYFNCGLRIHYAGDSYESAVVRLIGHVR